jgi:SAM-dependent methyltransferase
MSEKEKIQKKVNQLAKKQAWNHNFDLPYGIQTRPGKQHSHGKNLVKLERLIPLFDLIDLKEKKILDVGCNEGFFSNYMMNRGASVIGIDIDELRISKAMYVKKLLGDSSRLNFRKIDIYSEEFNDLNKFDLCLCLGFIHRVPDPFRAVKAISEHTNMIIFEWKALKFGPHDEPFAYFSPKPEDLEDYYGTEYWLLSFAALERILQRLGFKYFYRIDDPSQKRAILVAGKQHHAIFDRPSVLIAKSKFKIFLSHSKRYVLSIWSILSGKLNS